MENLRSESHTPEEIVKLVEENGDLEETIRLFARSSKWESICGALSLTYKLVGKCKEDQFLLEILVSIYPDNAYCHLLLGNLFLIALINFSPASITPYLIIKQMIHGKDGERIINMLQILDNPLYKIFNDKGYEHRLKEQKEMFRHVTLEVLNCSYDYACKKAEEQIKEALRLSELFPDSKAFEQAESAMASLVATVHMNECERDYS